jgi:hypothetical protein
MLHASLDAVAIMTSFDSSDRPIRKVLYDADDRVIRRVAFGRISGTCIGTMPSDVGSKWFNGGATSVVCI